MKHFKISYLIWLLDTNLDISLYIFYPHKKVLDILGVKNWLNNSLPVGYNLNNKTVIILKNRISAQGTIERMF